ncbi:MAG: peptidase T, partial [Caulobacteraceae bacterium]|nr:peptidase T [Caulobacter sp.]
DNKAAVAAVTTLLSELRRTGGRHGDVLVAFVPDEEVGLRGAKALDLARFPADWAYTIDGGARGEVVWETFNAASVEIDVTGVTAHPMSAKGVLVNPILIASDIMASFDRAQTPENTEGREGYWWFNGIRGDQNEAHLAMSIRDFDPHAFAERKRAVERAVEEARARHPRATIACSIEDRYGNIDAALGEDRRCVDLVLRAMRGLGITPSIVAMRGGTDGSALSARGLPTPNFFTGGLNFHSRFEFLPLSAFADAYRVAMAVVRLAAAT